MSVQDIDDIAKELFQRSKFRKREEKKSSVKKQAYPIEKANAFYNQFREEFNKMYIKTLINLRISRRKNPTLANMVKNDLLKVLSEESETINIDPSTHKLDFTNFRKNILKKTNDRIKKIHSRSELEAADKNPEISTSRQNSATNTEKNAEKEVFSLDKFSEQYNSLSTRQKKIDYIKETIVDDKNLSNDEKDFISDHIVEYLDYQQHVEQMTIADPNISLEKIRETYLEEYPNINREEFYENVNFAQAYITVKQSKEVYALLLEEQVDPEILEQLKDKIKADEAIVKDFMQKYHLTEKDAEELAQALNESKVENSATDEEYEQAEGEELEVDFYGDTIHEDDFDGLDSDKFADIYVKLTELQEQYEENPSLKLEQSIQQYQKIVDNYIEQNDLSEEDLITIIENADLEEETQTPISSILDDHGSVTAEIRQNLEQENDEMLETSTKIKENPIIQFFQSIQNRFTRKMLPSAQTALNSEDSAKPKQSFFSKIKNTFSKLSKQPSQESSVAENLTTPTEPKPNAWDLSDEKRQALQIGAKQIAEEMQNRPKSEKQSSVIETDQSLQN